MPSTKPKLQIYIDPDVEPHLKEWRANREPLTDSAAMNELLREFFGIHKEQGIEVFDWRWAIKEAIAPLLQKIEAIERQLATSDEVYSASFSELEIKFEAIGNRIGEIEAQFEQERESPKESPEELAEIPELQSLDEGDDLKNGDRVKMFHHNKGEWLKGKIRKLEGKDCWVIWDTDAEKDKPWCPGYRYPIELIELDREFPDNSPEEISLEDCQEKAIAILEAQLGQLSKAKLEAYSEQQLMDIIFITSRLLTIEQAEEVLHRILAAIPATPPLHEILGGEEEEVKLNLEGDSPDESPGESEPEKPLEELNHKDLATRLNIKPNTLRRARNTPGFAVWAQQHDAYGLLWKYDAEAKVYRGFKIKSV